MLPVVMDLLTAICSAGVTMIKGLFVINNHGKARVIKCFEHLVCPERLL